MRYIGSACSTEAVAVFGIQAVVAVRRQRLAIYKCVYI